MAIGERYIELSEMAEHYGFTLSEHGRCCINDIEAETVNDIFRMHLFGIPTDDIFQKLMIYQSPLPKGYSQWSIDLILEILKDECYAGYQFISDDGSVLTIHVGVAIIPKRMFAAAQALNVTENVFSQLERLNRLSEMMIHDN